MPAEINKIQSILESNFSIDNYVALTEEIFSTAQKVSPYNQRSEYSNFSSHIVGYNHVANYVTPDNKKLLVLAVELQKESYVENSRSTQRNYAKKLIESGDSDAAFIAFYTKDDPKWRLSFVRLDYEMKFDEGRLKAEEKITPAKRYSFLVGKDEPSHTAIERLNIFITDKNSKPTLNDLEEAFSVEKVTKEFFELYCEKYHELRESLLENEDFLAESETCGFTVEQFAKKLMGQIVFLYFLQKKGWMGVGAWPQRLTEREYNNVFYNTKGTPGRLIKQYLPQVYVQKGDEYILHESAIYKVPDDVEELIANAIAQNVSPDKLKNWGDGSKHFLRDLFEFYKRQNRGNFYNDFLEPLFYDTLNKNRGKRAYSSYFHCRIPFLSGGLFEPINNYDWKLSDICIPDEIFSNRIGNDILTGDGILDIFDRYNFTMSEDEPMEREVAIDPEMLGKVFENLLDVTDRKSKGAFYTPREIVHYMCQESLINYLANATGLGEGDIRDLIIYGDFMKDEDTVKEKRLGNGSMFISEEIFKLDENGNVVVNRLKDIDDALMDIRIADPAVGSGAFPVGMLNEIVRARQTLTEYMAIVERTKAVSEAQANKLVRNLRSDRTAYALKRYTIKNSIFAVDIEPSAVDIAQLRLWLSLVIDDEINPNATNPLEGHSNPIPLPNLECNILCGNSLVDEFEGYPLIGSNEKIGTNYEGREFSFFQDELDIVISKILETQDAIFSCDNPIKKEQLLKDLSALKDSAIETQLEFMPSDVRERYDESKELASKPYILWQLEFAKVFQDKNGFDIVIGNPPYIGFHKVPNKEYNKKHYISADGKYDFYVLFIERAIQLTGDNGFLSYICPSYFYKRNYGKKIRALLLEKTSIKFIADFSDYQIFDSALTYTCIFGSSKKKIQNNMLRVLNKNLSLNEAHYIPQDALTEPTWILEKSDTSAILDKVQHISRYTFGQITKSISQGIVSGNNDVFLIDYSIIDNLELEKDFLKKAYKGKDISQGELHDGGYMIFYPYVLNEKGKTVCISEDELKFKTPNMYSYLLEKKEELLSREYFRKSNKLWFELWNPRKLEHFYNRKFVFSEIGLVNDFAIVDECFYMDSVCGAELLDEYKQYEAFIHRYLNTRLATFIYKKISVPKANGYSIYKNAFLKSMPIILPEDDLDFMRMSDDMFDDYLYKLIGITNEEKEMIKNAQLSQAYEDVKTV